MSGLLNPYSASLLSLMTVLIGIGGVSLFNGHPFGFIPLVLGGLMTLGFKTISGSEPREMGLVTFLGKRTDITVEGLTLLLSIFGVEIIGVATFNMQQEDMDFPIESIRASDKVRMKGSVSISLVPDEGHLGKFDDAKQMKGIKALIDDMLPVWIATYATGDAAAGIPGKTHAELETNPKEIGRFLVEKLSNISPSDGDLNDLEGLGVKIRKMSVKLKPINEDLIKAGEDSVVEMLQRDAEIKDTETINKQTAMRHALYKATMPADKVPSVAACREEVMFERLAKDKKVTIIQGGKNVNLNTVGKTD